MSNEAILTWLTKWGYDWVTLHDLYSVFNEETDLSHYTEKFWNDLDTWLGGAYITIRHVPDEVPRRIEQYKLTKKAIQLLDKSA